MTGKKNPCNKWAYIGIGGKLQSKINSWPWIVGGLNLFYCGNLPTNVVLRDLVLGIALKDGKSRRGRVIPFGQTIHFA